MRQSGRVARTPYATARPRRRRAPVAQAPVVVAEPVSPPAPVAVAVRVARRARALHLAGELGLVLVLALSLGASWRDGVPIQDDGLNGPVPATAGPTFVSGRALEPGAQPLIVGGLLVPPEPAVPTARPLELLIPALDVHRAVEPVGVNRSGVMNLPVNSWNAGWYKGGPVPGAPGDAVIEGHAGYPGQPMIFGSLDTLRPGDRIIVVLADGSGSLFLVDSMSSVADRHGPAGPGRALRPARLTLVTCTGHFDKASYSYSQRLVVEAELRRPGLSLVVAGGPAAALLTLLWHLGDRCAKR